MAMKLQRKRKLSQVWPRVVFGLLVVLAATFVYAWYSQRPAIDEAAEVIGSTPAAVEEPKEGKTSLSTIGPQAPVRLKIDSIGVDAPIIPVGTEPSGAMAAPKTATDIGWYEKSALLGSPRRAMLLSGHYGLDVPEVLRRLNELKKDDILLIEGAKDDTATYRVVETERQHRTEVDMDKAFRYGDGQESVSIITCIGKFDHSAGTYDERYIVYALRVE